MKLIVLSWNVRRAKKDSQVWEVIKKINPDIITLQEVGEIPKSFSDEYKVISRKATNKFGLEQKFSTAILARGELKESALESNLDWVNKELLFFNGNIISAKITISPQHIINVISVYSPAWSIPSERLINVDVSTVKLTQSTKLWCTEILWDILRNNKCLYRDPWIVAGDFNASVTFDYLWSGGPSGNKEIMDRLNDLGLEECLSSFNNKLVPTFRNPKGGKIIHQIDHMFVSLDLFNGLMESNTLNLSGIFENSISDHLPIVSIFEL